MTMKFTKISSILEWNDAKAADERLAKKVSSKLQLGDIYFTYNVPLQVQIIYNKEEDPKSGINFKKSTILNYMPRKYRAQTQRLDEIFDMACEPTVKDIKDFMKVSGLILENLSKQFKSFKPLKLDNSMIYYPNTAH